MPDVQFEMKKTHYLHSTNYGGWMFVLEGAEPQLMFGSWHEVRQIGLRSGHYRSVIDGVLHATMLDFSYARNLVFYSEQDPSSVMFSVHS